MLYDIAPLKLNVDIDIDIILSLHVAAGLLE